MIIVHNQENAFVVVGHANDGGHESTREEIEACAAVTALAQGILFALDANTDDNPFIDVKPGYLYVSKTGMSDRAVLIVKAFFDAIFGVSTAYPDQITVLQ